MEANEAARSSDATAQRPPVPFENRQGSAEQRNTYNFVIYYIIAMNYDI